MLYIILCIYVLYELTIIYIVHAKHVQYTELILKVLYILNITSVKLIFYLHHKFKKKIRKKNARRKYTDLLSFKRYIFIAFIKKRNAKLKTKCKFSYF